MSWIYIALAVALVVLLINIVVVFLLRSWGTDVGQHSESQNH